MERDGGLGRGVHRLALPLLGARPERTIDCGTVVYIGCIFFLFFFFFDEQRSTMTCRTLGGRAKFQKHDWKIKAGDGRRSKYPQHQPFCT